MERAGAARANTARPGGVAVGNRTAVGAVFVSEGCLSPGVPGDGTPTRGSPRHDRGARTAGSTRPSDPGPGAPSSRMLHDLAASASLGPSAGRTGNPKPAPSPPTGMARGGGAPPVKGEASWTAAIPTMPDRIPWDRRGDGSRSCASPKPPSLPPAAVAGRRTRVSTYGRIARPKRVRPPSSAIVRRGVHHSDRGWRRGRGSASESRTAP